MDKTSVPNRNALGVDAPRLSVVMPVYNALPYLDAAVESILAQTFTDFEFLILDDGSTDGSSRRLRQWAATDRRIKLVEMGRNLGPALSSGRVARLATAPIVARMDADDICYPNRLERQFDLLQRHPRVGAVGSLCDVIDTGSKRLRSPEVWRLTRRSPSVPFPHGSLMYRRAVFDQAGGYRRECEYWEDQDLIFRLAALSKVMVIPEALYQYRQSTGNTRLVSNYDRLEQATDLAYGARARLERNSDYEDLLVAHSKRGKVDPRVFISLGSRALWAGHRPKVFRQLLTRGELALDMRSSMALAWTVWASVSPGSLRALLKLLVRLRNWRASRSVQVDRPFVWSPWREAPRQAGATRQPPPGRPLRARSDQSARLAPPPSRW